MNITDKPSILPEGSELTIDETVSFLLGMHDPVTGTMRSARAGDAKSATDEALANLLVRAALTGLDSSALAGAQSVAVEARAALAAQAYTLQRLLGDVAIRGNDGATYSTIATRAALAAQAYTLQRLLGDVAIRGDDGATYSAVGTRNALAAQAYTLQRLLSDSVMRGDDGATYSAIAARAAIAAQAYTLVRGLSDAVIRGDDGATYSAVGTRAALASQAYTLQRLLGDVAIRGDDGATYSAVASRAALAAQAYTLQRLLGDVAIRGNDGATYSAIGAGSTAAAQAYTLVRLLTDSVARANDGATYTPLSGRDATADANFAGAIFGLLANTRPGILDERTAAYARLEGVSAPGTSGNEAGLFAYAPRQDAFPASRRGRRFYTTHQTLGTFITGQTSIANTTPTFLLRQSGATVRAILRSITLTQMGTVAGGTIFIAVVLDTADRFSAGGVAITPQNVSGDSATASAITSFLTNPTATAAGAGTRVIVQTGAPATLGTITQILFNDGVIVPTTGALLVYTQAGTTGPSWGFVEEWEEILA